VLYCGTDDDGARTHGAGVQLPLRRPGNAAILIRMESDLLEALEASMKPRE